MAEFFCASKTTLLKLRVRPFTVNILSKSAFYLIIKYFKIRDRLFSGIQINIYIVVKPASKETFF